MINAAFGWVRVRVRSKGQRKQRRESSLFSEEEESGMGGSLRTD